MGESPTRTESEETAPPGEQPGHGRVQGRVQGRVHGRVQGRVKGRVRLTSLAGTVSALLLGMCFFLEWVRVDETVAAHFRRGVDKAIEDKPQKTRVDEDFEKLAEILETEGALTGMDLIYWVRTAEAFGTELESESEGGARGDAATQRALVVARALLYAMLSVGFLLAAYFLFHGFRRVTTPILILCVLVGASAVVLAGGLNYAHHLVRDALGESAAGVQPGPGPMVLLAGGAGLVLAGTFGVSLRNFFRVYAGAGVTAVGLYLLTLHYLQTGRLL